MLIGRGEFFHDWKWNKNMCSCFRSKIGYHVFSEVHWESLKLIECFLRYSSTYHWNSQSIHVPLTLRLCGLWMHVGLCC
jgi:hypothetical protein